MAPAPPTSPQKRVTRARAAAKKSVDDSKTSETQIASKPTTRRKVEAAQPKSIEADMPDGKESLRKSARRVGTAATTAPTRRIKVTPMNRPANVQQPPQHEEDASHKATSKSRATRSKNSAADEANVEEAGEPKNQVTSEAKGASKSKAPKLRGRPKKVENGQDEIVVETAEAPKQTRARTVSSATKARALAMAPSRTAAPKKKVTFQDVPGSDKENQPILKAKATTKAKSAALASGIRAKPIRRPAATSKAHAKQKATESSTEATSMGVLTPKKVTQVAKSSSPADSEEDELNGAKTPIRDLSQSPRRNVSIARTVSPVKKLDLAAATLTSSPIKSQPVPALLSPARRPAPSPFKDALKESPKRADLSVKVSRPPTSNEQDTAGKPASLSTSMLLQSPKRLPLDQSVFPQSLSKPRGSPFKASLLQSPPKRPVSPVKASPRFQPKAHPAPLTPEVDADTMSPDVTVSSQFKATQSPDRSSRVHKLTVEEIAEQFKSPVDFDESVVDIRSPLKLGNNKQHAFEVEEESHNTQVVDHDLKEECQIAQLNAHAGMLNEESVSGEEVLLSQPTDDVAVLTAAPASIMLRHETPVNPASCLFLSSRLGDDDESSEDELQSPIRMISSQTPATSKSKEPRSSLINREALGQKPGFTPLATQLSGWLASSPNKQPMKRYQQRGLFSPVAAQHVPGEIVIDRQSPATSRVSMEPRFPAIVRQSLGSRKFLGPRHSLAASMDGTPDKSTYFADEMAVKDLEEKIENMQAEAQADDEQPDANSEEDVHVQGSSADDIAHDVEVLDAEEEDALRLPEDQTLIGNMLNTSHEVSRKASAEIEAGKLREQAEDKQRLPGISQESTASSAYGDENEVPTSPAAVLEHVLANFQHSNSVTSVPVSSSDRHPFNNFTTPSGLQPAMSRFANTVVSKVPLRAEGDVFPIKVPKKRSRSLSAGPPSVKRSPVLHNSEFPRSTTINTFSPVQSQHVTPYSMATTSGQNSFAIDDFGDSTLDGIDIDEDDENLPPVTPTSTSIPHLAATPSKAPKLQTPAARSVILQGAVVFVDVHTTEGADASGIFIELLTQMGAKCVKNWPWNPRASMGASVGDSSVTTAGNGKIGITHVVYKDGGKRTLEKVRDTEGVVKCVGVGWVLEYVSPVLLWPSLFEVEC
jgi:hypothetical protein